MGGRGTGGNSKAKGGNGAVPKPGDRDRIDASAKPGANPNDAADELGISPDAKPSFVNGADDMDNALKPAADRKPVNPVDALAGWRIAIDVYERRHGRAKARAYSRGGYWALVRALKTALAVGAVFGVTVPGQGAVNAGLVGSYWATTR